MTTAVSPSSVSRSTITDGDPILAAARALGPLIREHADEAERNRRLSPRVIAALTYAGMYWGTLMTKAPAS